jgi:hypothetical protein
VRVGAGAGAADRPQETLYFSRSSFLPKTVIKCDRDKTVSWNFSTNFCFFQAKNIKLLSLL